MDYAACNVVYVDRTAQEDRLVRREDATSTAGSDADIAPSPILLEGNLQTLLGTFSEVHICTSGKSCISKLSELNQSSIVELIPTLVLIDIPYEDESSERPSRNLRTPSPSSRQHNQGLYEEPSEVEAYGLKLLQWISSEIQYQSLSRLVVPVAVVSIPYHSRWKIPHSNDEQPSYTSNPSSQKQARVFTPLDQVRTMRYLDNGAVDVLTSPLLLERLPSLAIHAYRAHKDASKEQRALLEMKRGRKRSWVGIDDQKPYAYLREAMVSGLMDGICKLGGEDEPFGHVRISIAPNRRELIVGAVGSWHFSAHDFTDDELLHAALLMLQHALAMPELEKWRISTENLTGFLVASRSAYNAFVPYHNFRHVVDVLQAIFHFLVQLGRLPPYPVASTPPESHPSPIAALIRPFDALTLLITAIGHDVGHPGVNNAFLITLNAPLAQLYNDQSVLESFHCAAYSQILRRHWPAAFQGVEMRKLMISSILATDMGLHFDYMKRLGYLQEKLHENGGTDGWNGRLLEEQRTLACSLLIKCADISNVARKYDVAARWTMILTDEFARQASMEKDLGIPSALFAAPVREIIELGKSQLGFMNMFAIPLFQGVSDVMPAMTFCVDELHQNKSAWEQKIAEEQTRVRQESGDSFMTDGMFSPRTMSVAVPSDTSHQKISNATLSLSSDSDLRKALLSKSPFSPSNGVLDENEPHHRSLPELSTSIPNESEHPSPSEVIPDSSSRRSSKPSQLQLSYATTSAPGLVDHPSQDPHLANGISVQPSLVTDAVVAPPVPHQNENENHGEKQTGIQGGIYSQDWMSQTSMTTTLVKDRDEGEIRRPRSYDRNTASYSQDGDWMSQATIAATSKIAEMKEKEEVKQRSSDGTEVSTDWTSQATSATTSKMPLSPSTQGTSIMSQESLEKSLGSHQTPTGEGSIEGKGNSMVTVGMEKMRSLRKKPSRFRMNFWKRSKSASPPMPVQGHCARGIEVGGTGRSDDDGRLSQ